MSTPFVLPTLPPGATQTNAYLTDLMARCATLAWPDVVQQLRGAYVDQWALGFEQCAQFVERLPHFVKMHLDPNVQAELKAPDGLLAVFVRKMKLAERKPENFSFWGVGERQRLEERRQQLIKWAEQAQQGGRRAEGERHLKDAAHIERILIGLGAKEASGVPGNFYLDATELDSWCPPTVAGVSPTPAVADLPPAQALDAPTAATAKLSLRQVALLYIYEGKVITKAADEIARQHGHRSGAKLYEHYRKLSHRTGRTGVEGQQLAPMINDIAAVITRLTGKVRQQAESELQTLEARK